MRFLAFALLLAFAFTAKADGIFTKNVIGVDGIYSGKSIGGASGINNGSGSVTPPPPTCTPDGGTDWSNACDLPLLPAIGF